MSNNDHIRNKHSAVVEEEIPISVESQHRSQDFPEGSGKLNRILHGLREHPSKLAVVVLALLAIVIVIGYLVRNAFLYEDTDDAQVDGHVMPLSARINGQVMKVNFVEGQLVHEGEVLVLIDPADFKIAVIQAEAALADAQASATSSRWNVPITSVTAQSSLDSAQTAVVNAEAGLRAAEHYHESTKASLRQAQANAGKSDLTLSAPNSSSQKKISPASNSIKRSLQQQQTGRPLLRPTPLSRAPSRLCARRKGSSCRQRLIFEAPRPRRNRCLLSVRGRTQQTRWSSNAVLNWRKRT
jgi:hypothetical protein